MIGEQVGQLKIVRQLGAGGMGAVYLGVHAVLGVKRAVKFLLPEFTQNAFVAQRFLNEARAASKLAHRNIVQVHDVGQLHDGTYFIVFDYVEGQTLAQFIETYGGPLPPQEVVRIVAQIANALCVAHPQGIIHRDLKPENVLLTARDGDACHVVVVDWGIAQLANDPEAGPQTKSGVVLGTPAYMPPEQIRGQRVGASADVFALGTIAYRLATGGWFPYQHENSRHEYYCLTPTEICLRQLARPAPDPREREPLISVQFAHALVAALDANPEHRPSPQQYALLLAEAAPSDGVYADGLDVVQAYARELVDHTSATLRVAARPSTGGAFDQSAVSSGRLSRTQVAGRPSVPAVTPAPRAVGRVHLESRYKLRERLGQGGMAEVYLASMIGAEGFARTVAIKRVLPGFSEAPAFADLFVAEATIAARLSHPNIVTVFDFDRDDEGRLFLVMEYVNGKDLATLLAWGPLPVSLIIFIVAEMLRGLGYAHSVVDPASNLRGVIHRDMSPQNLILSYEGAVKVVDFGLAKALQGSDGDGAHSGTVRGKPRYMSPEQVNAEPLDNRSDLFAVGIMLWEMLARKSLFRGIPKEVMGQVLFYDIPRPGTIHKGVPGDVEAVAMKLLQRDRNARYATADAAIADLLRCKAAPRDGRGELSRTLVQRFGPPGERAAGDPRNAGQHGAPPLPTTFGAAATGSSFGPSGGRKRAILAVLVALVVSGGVATAVLLASQDEAPAGLADSAPPPVDAAPLDTAPLDAALDAGAGDAAQALEPTRLYILADASADVSIDGTKLGVTPAYVTVTPGKHTITIKTSRRSKDYTVYARPNQLTTVGPRWD